MNKNIKGFYILSVLYVLLFLNACKNNDYQIHESGLKYKIVIENKNAKKPKVGDILVLDMNYSLNGDSLLFSSKEVSSDFKMQMKKLSHKGGCIEDAFSLMHEGDSCEFFINASDFYTITKKQQNPKFITNTDLIKFNIKLKRIIDAENFQQEMAAKYHTSEKEEMNLLEHFLNISNIKDKPSETGVYTIEKKKGNGKKPQKGNKITMHYVGKFIDGQIFDLSYEKNIPLKFIFGNNEIIKGLEEAVAKLSIGSNAMIIIPSKMAYGEKQSGPIPPFSTLIFEIEILNIE